MKEDIALHPSLKYPDLTTVTLAQSVSSNGIVYRNGMIIVHGSVGGLPEFAEVLQMRIKENTLIFICRNYPCGTESTTEHLNFSHLQQERSC